MPRSHVVFVIGSALFTLASAMVAFAALAAGCSAAPEVGEIRANIIGGSVDTGDPSVVVLFAQVPGQQGGSLCTAEIISPHVVLTAAHCVSPAEVGQGAVFSVYSGTNFDQAQPADLLAVSETHFDPLFSTQNLGGGHDIGVAILSKPAPVPAIAINRTPLDATFVGKPVRFVGFGLDNAQAQTGAGTRRQTTTTLSDYSALLVHFTDGLHETCNGDSGGPAFMTVNAKEVIVGLTSYGDVNCNQGGYDTRVDALTTFVDTYVTQFDPAAATPPDMAHAAPPDMAHAVAPVDMAQPLTPSSPPTTTTPSTPPTTTTPTTTPTTPSQPASTVPTGGARGLGESCGKDGDCASNLCGLSTKGTLICVAGNGASDTLGGCSLSGSDDQTTLGFLVMMAIVLSRSLMRRRR